MEKNIDFIELAEYCRKEYEEKHTNSESSYEGTFYVAVSKDDEITVSTTPHILRDAHRCILIHKSEVLDGGCWCYHHKFEMIDEKGAVHNDLIDENCSITMIERYYKSEMTLNWHDSRIATFTEGKDSYKDAFPKFWKLYLKCRECSCEEEAILLGRLYEKDQKILELERENDSLKYAKKLLEMQKEENDILLRRIKDALDIAEKSEGK